MIPMKKNFAILLSCIVCQGVSFAQQYASTVETFRIAGKVTDMHDGYNVIDARVEISWENHPVEFSPFMHTDLDGFYTLVVPKGKLKLQVRALGYEDGEMDLDVTRDMVVNVELEPATIDDREHFARGWDKVVIKKVLEFEAKGGADILYVDVPQEVKALQLETAECTAYGPRDIARFGKKYLGCTQILTLCDNGKQLDDKKYRALLRQVKYYPYDRIVFNGFMVDGLRSDSLLTFRRKDEMMQEIDATLCKIGKADQAARMAWVNFSMGTMSQEQAVEYALQMERTDSINLVTVERILDTYGWPSGLSEDANNAIFLVIDHSNLETMNKYLGVFQDAASRGILPMQDLVTLEDRILMNSGKPQFYGTQSRQISKDGKTQTYIWPVCNPDSLNERRASVGLSTIEEYLELFAKRGITVIYDPELTVEFFK
jgi:hypothetical protein